MAHFHPQKVLSERCNPMERIAVIDYGMGNLRSVEKALAEVACSAVVRVTDDPDEIANADRVVFPGQGAMPDCIAELERRNLTHVVKNVSRDKPFLGICIGLQLLFESSEEGDSRGLSILQGEVKKFRPDRLGAFGEKFKVPHMGWNSVNFLGEHPVLEGLSSGERFYFVHSYHVQPTEKQIVLGTTEYCAEFPSVVVDENIVAVQFHPEKSQAAGLKLLSNFVSWKGA